MEEERQQLNEVIKNVALLLLHSYDVWWKVGPVLVYFQVLVPRKEAKLEEIFHYNRHLHMDDKKKKSFL